MIIYVSSIIWKVHYKIHFKYLQICFLLTMSIYIWLNTSLSSDMNFTWIQSDFMIITYGPHNTLKQQSSLNSRDLTSSSSSSSTHCPYIILLNHKVTLTLSLPQRTNSNISQGSEGERVKIQLLILAPHTHLYSALPI